MYSSTIYFTLLYLLSVLEVILSVSITSYRAAVFEHAVIVPPYTSVPVSRQTALQNMEKNLVIFRQQATEARRQGANILILPEDGLYGYNFTREMIYPYLEFIPDPEDVVSTPCNDPDTKPGSEIQHALSCMAKNNAIYLVANMGAKQPCDHDIVNNCPTNGYFQYNTAVVYGPDGKLLARYHKVNLYKEYQFDYPEPKVHYFDTPFGRFGLLVCFDLMFSEPIISMLTKHMVTNVVLPTAWMDSLPLLSAIGYHSSVARGLKLNLLSANLHLPNSRIHGSGIFTPDGMTSFYYNHTPGSPCRLLVSDVKIIGPPPNKSHTDPSMNILGIGINVNDEKRETFYHRETSDQLFDNGHQKVSALGSTKHAHDYLSWQRMVFSIPKNETPAFHSNNYTFIRLNVRSSFAHICRKNVCCHLIFDITSDVNLTEMFVLGAFDGLYHNKYYFQVCAVLKCPSLEKTTCGSPAYGSWTRFTVLELAGSFTTGYIFPQLVLSRNDQLELAEAHQWSFRNNTLSISHNITTPILLAALLGRFYDHDRKIR